MHALKKILTCASFLSLAACATIQTGDKASINVTTAPASSATCYLSNTRENVHVDSGSTAVIKKSMSDLEIECDDVASGAKGKTKLYSSLQEWDIANLLTLGLGQLVDWGTGAAYTYPSEATIPLAMPASATALMPVIPMAPMAPMAPIYNPPVSPAR